MDSTTQKNWWQRNWKWVVPVAGGILLVGITCAVLLFMILFGALKSSDVYQMALKEAQSNPDVVRVLGEPVKPGWWLSGLINVSGSSGHANLTVPISGPREAGTLYIVATKTAGQWQFSTLEVAVADQAEHINLLSGSGTALLHTPTPPSLLPTATSVPVFLVPDTPTPPVLLPTPSLPPTPASFLLLRESVYQQAIKAASANTEVVQALGEPIEGTDFDGVIDTSGALGEVDIAVSISGPENSGTLYVVATKRTGRELWNFTILEVLVDGQGEPIDLLAGGPLTTENQQTADIHYERGNNYFNAANYEQAMAEYTQATEFDPEFVAAFNGLCWTGSLAGQAAEVLSACERAVELAPDHGGYRDSRGLARALTGDYAGAIEDFKFYVVWSNENGLSDSRVSKREAWIAALEAQRNPFDEATLKALQNE